MDYILQERIDGTLNLAEGTVSELTVWLHDRPEMTVTVTGDMSRLQKINPLRRTDRKADTENRKYSVCI